MIIALSNLKGGVGKTTLATNLAVAFALDGKSVCIVDTDKEQTSSIRWSEQRDDDKAHIAVIAIGVDRLLRETEQLSKKYDVIILDGSPNASELAITTIMTSDVVLVPVSKSAYDFWAMDNFLAKYKQAKAFRNDIQAFIVLNKFNEKQNVAKEVKEAIERDFADIPMLQTVIHDRVAYTETITEGIGVLEYKDKKAKDEIKRLYEEVSALIMEPSYS
jgi:chromosome partitioning protein